jgi:hypothetical protein
VPGGYPVELQVRNGAGGAFTDALQTLPGVVEIKTRE